jgi:hypothetical protein
VDQLALDELRERGVIADILQGNGLGEMRDRLDAVFDPCELEDARRLCPVPRGCRSEVRPQRLPRVADRTVADAPRAEQLGDESRPASVARAAGDQASSR